MKRARKVPARKPAKDDFYRAPPAGPDYIGSQTKVEIINGKACVSIDADKLASLNEWYRNAKLI